MTAPSRPSSTAWPMPSKRKPRPAPARPAIELMETTALRLPASLRAEIAEDAARLGMDASSWMRAAARAKLDAGVSSELRAIRELLEQARQRGVTLEALRTAIDLELD